MVPDTNYRRRIEALEAQVLSLRAQYDERSERRHFHRDSFLAITVDAAGYPDENQQEEVAPKYPIIFLDAHFTDAPGWEAITVKQRNDPQQTYQAVACNITSDYVPPNTLVEVTRHRGLGPDGAGEWFMERAVSPVVLFELTAELTLEGQAEAVLLRWDGSDYVTTQNEITVTNYAKNPGMFSGRPGYRGAASLVRNGQGSPVYEIVWMEHQAEVIRFELKADLTQGQAEVKVLDWWDGKRPPDPVIVHDPHSHWPYALKTAKGWARWNKGKDILPWQPAVVGAPNVASPEGRYEVIEVDQRCLLGSATADAGVCGTEADRTVAISGFTAATPSTFSQKPDPLPSSAENRHGFPIEQGDKITLMWDEAAEKWVIVAVDCKSVTVGDGSLSYSNCTLHTGRKIIRIPHNSQCEQSSNGSLALKTVDLLVASGIGTDAGSSAGSGDDSCSLTNTKRTGVCVFDDGTLGQAESVYSFPDDTYVTTWGWNANTGCFEWVQRRASLVCLHEAEPKSDCTPEVDCPEDSSS